MKLLVLLLACLVLSAQAAPQKRIHKSTLALEAVLGYNHGRIVGGVNALPGEFPHIVSVQWILLTASTHICGGSVLSPNWVLTAAHCITESPTIGRLEILAGKWNLAATEPTQQARGIAQSIIHPGYAGGVGPDDVALFRLQSALVYNPWIGPIALPTENLISSGAVTLAGWGSTSTTQTANMPDILQKVTKPIVPFAECEAAVGGAGATPLHSSNLCTGPLTGGVGACSGDSGGPLIQMEGARLVQVGIVSWGWVPCGSIGLPSVYGRVSHYISWINGQMA